MASAMRICRFISVAPVSDESLQNYNFFNL